MFLNDKRLISGGGAKIGDENIVDDDALLTIDLFLNGSREITVRVKKRVGVVELK